MKKLFTTILLLSIAALTFAQKAGDKISFETVDFNGKAVSSSQIFAKNKITMINVWGTFCGPCIREMPELAQISEEYKGKGFEIIGIAIDLLDNNGKVIASAKADGEAIIKQTGVKYTNLVPSFDMIPGFLENIQAVPTTVFVDSEGKVVSQAVLGARNKKQWKQIIDFLLK